MNTVDDQIFKRYEILYNFQSCRANCTSVDSHRQFPYKGQVMMLT